MNKQQIIAPLATIALVFLVGFIVKSRHGRDDYLVMRAIGIGHELIQRTNSSAIVHLGSSLSNQLVILHSAPASIHRVRLGDFGPSTDKAKVCLYLTNEAGLCLGIRMRPDTESDQFHILGYWTESRPPE